MTNQETQRDAERRAFMALTGLKRIAYLNRGVYTKSAPGVADIPGGELLIRYVPPMRNGRPDPDRIEHLSYRYTTRAEGEAHKETVSERESLRLLAGETSITELRAERVEGGAEVFATIRKNHQGEFAL